MGEQTSFISRLDENSWKIDIERPFRIVEYGYQVSFRGGSKDTLCTGYSAGGWWTEPVKYSLKVRRVQNQN
jgi:hypothetical protein